MGAAARYRTVWQIPNAPTLLCAGLIARLGIGMTPLALLLLVEEATGRYAAGGLAVGCYAIAGACANPLAARLADRIGSAPVLRVTALAHAAVLGLLSLLTVAPLPVLLVVSVLAGATYPPLTGAIRGAWTTLVEHGRPLSRTAMAAETSLFELVYVAGPLLVAGLAWTTGGHAATLLVAAAVTAYGSLAVARVPAMRIRRRVTHHRLRPAPGFGSLLTCVALLGAAFGAVTVGVPAFAAGHGGGAGLGGLLLGVWGVGSACGGAWFGTWRPAADPVREYAVLLALAGLGFLALVAMPGPWTLGCALVAGGVVMAPALIVENTLVSRIAHPAALTESYTWVITTAITCSAAGSAVAGLLVDRTGGVRWVFTLAAALAMTGATIAARPGGPLARADRVVTARLRATADLARCLPALRPQQRRLPGFRTERQVVGDPVTVAAIDRTSALDGPSLLVTGGALEEQGGGVERHVQQS